MDELISNKLCSEKNQHNRAQIIYNVHTFTLRKWISEQCYPQGKPGQTGVERDGWTERVKISH